MKLTRAQVDLINRLIELNVKRSVPRTWRSDEPDPEIDPLIESLKHELIDEF